MRLGQKASKTFDKLIAAGEMTPAMHQQFTSLMCLLGLVGQSVNEGSAVEALLSCRPSALTLVTAIKSALGCC
jgi:hypothetical protein